MFAKAAYANYLALALRIARWIIGTKSNGNIWIGPQWIGQLGNIRKNFYGQKENAHHFGK